MEQHIELADITEFGNDFYEYIIAQQWYIKEDIELPKIDELFIDKPIPPYYNL